MKEVNRLWDAVEKRVTDFLTKVLTQPLQSYEQRVPNSLERLKTHLRPCDVILVEGDQRVSQVIRYLTQSSWSHTAIYLGDALQRYQPEMAEKLREQFGDEVNHLLLESDAEDGVSCTTLSKYTHHNLRVCRPQQLRQEDAEHILDYLMLQFGRKYNFRHILELARYLFPVSMIPRRYRSVALRYGGETTREVICSTLLARAFATVGYPIRPRVIINKVDRPVSWFRRVLGRQSRGIRAVYQEENPALITPRDFDLSPYFDVVKFNYLAGEHFDYRQIEWVKAAPPALETPATAVVDSPPAPSVPSPTPADPALPATESKESTPLAEAM